VLQTTDKSKAATPVSTPSKLPWFLLFGLFSFFAARWIWIAGMGDYAWHYETGMRVLKGEVPYSDFLTTQPQLATYTITPLLWLFKGNLLAAGVHLYLWWLASMTAGLILLKRLGAGAATQSVAVFFMVCVSRPATLNGFPHSYAAAACFGAGLVCLVHFIKKQSGFWAAMVGIWVSLAVLAKQNIGAGLFIAALLTFGQLYFFKGQHRKLLQTLGWFALGTGLSFFPVLAYFAFHAGLIETVRQMVFDAIAGKGGFKQMLFNLLPMFFFERSVPHRHLWDVLLTLGFNGFLLVYFFRKVFSRNEVPARPELHRESSWRYWILAGAIFVISFSLLALVDMPQLKPHLQGLAPYFFYGSPVFWFQGAFLCLGAVGWLHSWFSGHETRSIILLWLLVFACAFHLSVGAGFYAIPIALPLFMFLLKEYGMIQTGARFAAVVSSVLVGANLLFPPPYCVPSFEPLYKLPQDSPFAHLYAPGWYARFVKDMHAHVTPSIRGHRTLWLSCIGPQLAFGGLPVRAVPQIFSDTYSARLEEGMVKHWERFPPDFVVRASYTPAAGSMYFTVEYLNKWLPKRYEKIWQSQTQDMTLWRHQSLTTLVSGNAQELKPGN
jgi:hypothetical protein